MRKQMFHWIKTVHYSYMEHLYERIPLAAVTNMIRRKAYLARKDQNKCQNTEMGGALKSNTRDAERPSVSWEYEYSLISHVNTQPVTVNKTGAQITNWKELFATGKTTANANFS